MDIPVEIMYELKCSRCKVYLSRDPVYLLKHDGDSVCGQCYTSERPAIRNEQYEAAAKLLKFPWCKYRESGCPVTVDYMQEAEVLAHEAECKHRQYVCPVLGPARCDWLGPRAAMLAHCCAQHPGNVLENSCSFTHDIARSSQHNYLITAHQLLFVLHTRMCVATGMISHTVMLLGTSAETENYFFNLDIKIRDKQDRKIGQVVPVGCLAIQECTSLSVTTNLPDELGDFSSATFIVTVKRRVKCAGCAVEVTEFLYRKEDGWRCERCAPAKRACRNQILGCPQTDINNKCYKHEYIFCQYQQGTMCNICKVNVCRGSLSAHHGSVHQDITHSAGSTWRVTQPGRQDCLVPSVAGTALCYYSMCSSLFSFEVYTPVSSEQLSEFRCEVRVTDPATGHTVLFMPDAMYDAEYDWRIEVKREEFPSCNTGLDVCVDIRKAEA